MIIKWYSGPFAEVVMRNWESGGASSLFNSSNLEASEDSTLPPVVSPHIRKCTRGMGRRSPSCSPIISLTGFNLNNAACGFYRHAWCPSTPYYLTYLLRLFDIHRCYTNPYYIFPSRVLCFMRFTLSTESCSVYSLFSFQLYYRENGKLTRLLEDWIMELDYSSDSMQELMCRLLFFSCKVKKRICGLYSILE